MTDWRAIQRKNFTCLEDLASFLELDNKRKSSLLSQPKFPLNFPRRLAEKAKKNTLDDPILRQFLPLNDETLPAEGFIADPVSDCSFQKTPRLLQKYSGRALLLSTSGCVMNCRFCFRQNYPYLSDKDFSKEIALIKKDPSLHEIILSGGDPLSLGDAALKTLIDELGTIPHLKLLRFHTRFPLGIPERITPTFLSILENTTLQPIFLLHTNHPDEIDSDVAASLKKIQHLGVPILSQTVLLRGINDSLSTLKTLFLKLVSHGIIPYYLHQLDRVTQASHFEVPITDGQALIETLRSHLPGYAIPTYVQEVPMRSHKTPL